MFIHSTEPYMLTELGFSLFFFKFLYFIPELMDTRVMTSRDITVGVSMDYVRIGKQRNRGFISNKSTSALETI